MQENQYQTNRTATRAGEAVDEGLRSHMLGIYNYMAMGVAVTGILSYLVYSMATVVVGGKVVGLTELGQLLYASPLRYVLMIAPLAFVLLLSFGVNKLSATGAHIAYWAFAAVMGVSISSIFIAFTGESIVQIFFVTAAAFAGLSAWGYTTKKDLSGWGSFLVMGVIGLIIASIVNWFLQSSAMQFAISAIAVLVFAGLTAYDTQRLKDEYLYIRHDGAAVAKAAILGALSLYLDFINMFMALLQLFGSSND